MRWAPQALHVSLSDSLQLISGLCSLAGPVVLRKLLQTPSTSGILALFAFSLIATLTGRSKDQVCRVQATQIATMLKFGLFDKSLRLSFASRARFAPSTIINILSHDVLFFQNYFLGYMSYGVLLYNSLSYFAWSFPC